MERIEVAAALIEKDRKLLITKRKQDTHLAGYWEFPGGKKKGDEELSFCLVREIKEELGIEVRVGGEVFAATYDYPDRKVFLHFFHCEWESGEPRALGCQEFRWIERSSLEDYEFPPANLKLIHFLKQEEYI